MNIIRCIDRWNENKVWIIKHYSDGHYYVNQEIRGKIFYNKFQRSTRRFINSIFESKVV